MFAKHSREAACSAREARLEDYIEGCLDSGQAREVEEHIQACARCAAALDRAKDGAGLLAVLRDRPLPAADAFFAGRVMVQIRQRRRDQELWKPVETAGRQLCWLAAVAALVLAVFMLRFQVAAPPVAGNATAQQVQIQELIRVPISQPAVQDDALLVASSNAHAR
ncbi:MAG TPA: zf-HC2 domain-containing protein [Candidatus Dormibacteraeota bacterium]|nr:zf-HC2 domain-containing protein [Candidatus Dormibacteraeota bacterium]